MDAPSLVLIPPSPFTLSFVGPSPASTAPSTPDLSSSTTDHERNSSEASIPSIYSMYSDRRGSWSASRRNSDDIASGDPSQAGRSKTEDPIQRDAAAERRYSARTDTLRASATPNGSPYLDVRPTSSLPREESRGVRVQNDSLAKRTSSPGSTPNRSPPVSYLDTRPPSDNVSSLPREESRDPSRVRVQNDSVAKRTSSPGSTPNRSPPVSYLDARPPSDHVSSLPREESRDPSRGVRVQNDSVANHRSSPCVDSPNRSPRTSYLDARPPSDHVSSLPREESRDPSRGVRVQNDSVANRRSSPRVDSPNRSPRTSYLDARPPSDNVSSLPYTRPEETEQSVGQKFVRSIVPASSDHERPGDRPLPTRPTSQYRKSETQVIVPPPRSSSRLSSTQNGDSSLPPRMASPRPASQLLVLPETPPSASHLLRSPETPPSTPPQPPLKSHVSSPDSNRSIAPSEGEDAESFHVRSTYAQLEAIGVKGDGYEEGIERTRARVGFNRLSELRAEAALADGNEKVRELTRQEIETLASLDRYGFFAIPSHDRLVLLPTAPLLKPFVRMTAAPRAGTAAASSLSAVPAPTISAKELSRIAKWDRMLEPLRRDEGGNIEIWKVKRSKEHKLRERTYKGIPDRWRSAAWELLMANLSKTGKREMALWAEEYRESMEKSSSYDIQIDLDVPRTISGHIMFRTRYGSGQRSLFHVLHCFSLRCPQCGYCQGMGPIAATLLCYFDPERAYASLVRLHDAYAMHTIFQPGFPGLLESIYVQERLTEQMMPGVYEAFKKHMISTTSYATKWYITLFANSVPFQTQLRLWDVFLLEGYDIFVIVAISIVWVYRDHITSNAANFETVLSLLSSFFVPEDENALLAWIGKVLEDKKLRTNIRQWREDWRRLVADGKDGDALL